MKIIDYTKDNSTVEVSADELLIFNAALNEVSNGIALFEFDTRIGASREEVAALLTGVSDILDKMQQKK
ncbi:MAG: hypothetical protein A3F78_08605 [Burkholderiales bacterium RIFCSPLOWO2_12_FULL_61_40]|nr:MAG: hypothetical protein A3F78_08605 [Burkholderiales bacterium RIFCSPLOWO2_12_FULL_61_40]